MASDKRILELALKGLEAERDVILAEIAEVRARLGGRIAKRKRKRAVQGVKNIVGKKASSVKETTRKMTAAQKKAISDRMKKVWASRRKAGTAG